MFTSTETNSLLGLTAALRELALQLYTLSTFPSGFEREAIEVLQSAREVLLKQEELVRLVQTEVESRI